MKLARKIRLEVESKTIVILDSQSKIVNWMYNHLLEQANQLRAAYCKTQDGKQGLTLYSKRGLRNLIPQLKKDHPFLKAVYSSPLKNAALRLSRAIQKYQKARKGKRGSKEVGWPRFRVWKRQWFSLEYDEPWKGYTLEGRTLTLQLGMDADGQRLCACVELVESLPSDDAALVKQLRIVKEAGQFFAVFTLDKEVSCKQEKHDPKVIALDPNHKNLAYGVDTQGQAIEIMNLFYLKKLDERIDLLKSRRDCCQRQSKLVEYAREDGSIHRHWQPSHRWKFFNHLLEQAYQKRREQTKTFLYTLANHLCHDYDVMGVGDYTPSGGGLTPKMRRAMNNRSLIGRFKEVIAWVAVKSGKIFIEYEESGTTRTCHLCHYQVPGGIDPDIREWICPSCHILHIRDENAAHNGLVRTLEKLNLPRSGHTPVTIQVRWAWQVTPSGVLALRGGGTAQAATL